MPAVAHALTPWSTANAVAATAVAAGFTTRSPIQGTGGPPLWQAPDAAPLAQPPQPGLGHDSLTPDERWVCCSAAAW